MKNSISTHHLLNYFKKQQLWFILLLVSAHSVSAQTTTTITLNIENATIEEIINTIEEKSEYHFLYNKELVDVTSRVSIKVVNQPLAQVLKTLFFKKNISYIIDGRQIVLSQKEKIKPGKIKTVEGKVIDQSGEPIIGANIIVHGTKEGTITDINGDFSIQVSEDATLDISYIGYIQKSESVIDKNHLSIKLTEDQKLLEEVVVIGYGSVKKSDLTGAVSSVKTKDMSEVGSVSIGQMLSGKAAGLQVLQNSAQPGGGVSFLIRGAASVGAGNTPLIIIDGFPVSSFSEPGSGNTYDGGSKSDLNSINPNDIESIEVLKDASATAIYGSRAANGVVLITTKRGKEGRVNVEYNGSFSGQAIADKYEIMSASELMQTINTYKKEEYLLAKGYYPYGTIVKTENEINLELKPTYNSNQIANPTANTNWFNEIVRNGMITQHNLSINGGSKGTQYLASLNYYKQNGVIKNSGLERYTGRINLDQKLNKYFKMGVSATGSRVNNTNSQLGGQGNELSGIIRSALTFPTYLPIYDEDGTYMLSSTQPYLPNPISLLDINDQSIIERLLGTAYVETYPIKGLTLRASLGLDRNIGKRTTYLPKTTLYGAKEGGKASINTNERLDLLSNIVATYSITIQKDHKITGMAGYEYQTFQTDGYGASNSDFLLDSFLWYNLAAGEAKKPTVYSSGAIEKMASYFARIHYGYKDRYLFTGTFRADGSSKFAKNKKWGYFPSMAIAWRITEENFMSNAKPYLSNLKLRVSYGSTGNANIGYNAFAVYRTGNNFQFGDKVHTGVYPAQLENPNLSWETTTELNVGIDFGFLNERVNGSAEFFHKVIDGLLSSRQLPSFNEITTIADNIGKTQSTGFEFTLNSENIKNRNFTWNTTLTFSLYRDRWLERDPTWIPSIYQSKNDYIRNNFFYQSDGLIKPGEIPQYMTAAVPGQVKLLDRDGFLKDKNGNRIADKNGKFCYQGKPDGILDDADIVNYGNADPGYMVGFNNTFLLKGIDLSIYLYGYLDRMMVDPSSQIGIIHQLEQHQGGPKSLMDSWRHDNMESTQPSYIYSSYGFGNYLMQDASFIRCKNITLGYTFPKKSIEKAFQKLRIYADFQNPFIITNYTGLDPETDAYTAAYPNVRTFSIGLDLTF